MREIATAAAQLPGNHMKLVTAVIEPRTVSRVRKALDLFGVTALSVSAARMPHQPRVETYRGTRFYLNTAAATRLDVLCDLFDAEDVVAVIVAAARCGAPTRALCESARWTGSSRSGALIVSAAVD